MEFLNSSEKSWLLQHTDIIKKKTGAPVAQWRFINGTRLAVEQLWNVVNEATVITGHVAGNNIFIYSSQE